MKCGKQIKMTRIDFGITAQELANESGVSRQTIDAHENDRFKTKPSFVTHLHILQELVKLRDKKIKQRNKLTMECIN